MFLEKLTYGTRVVHVQPMQKARIASSLSAKVTCASWAPLAMTGANVTLLRLSNVSFDLHP